MSLSPDQTGLATGVCPSSPRKLPMRKRHLSKSYISYDKATPGSCYAPHDPMATERIDSLALLDILVREHGTAKIRPIVGRLMSTMSSTGITVEKRASCFPDWNRLDQETKAFTYGLGSARAGMRFTHVLTLHLTDEEVQNAYVSMGKGPAYVVGQFIARNLSPIFRRTMMNLRYLYVLETCRMDAVDDDGRRLRTKSKLDSFHASIFINIPASILGTTRKRICEATDTSLGKLHLHGSGSRAHLRQLSEDVEFWRGSSATGRRDVLGRIDYAAKGFVLLRELDAYYRRGGNDRPFPLSKLCGASADVVMAGRDLYERYRRWLTSPAEPENSFYIRSSDETVRRIVDSHPLLGSWVFIDLD